MNAIFEKIKTGTLMNLMLIPGLITKAWTISSTNPTESSPRTNAYDGNRSTSFDVGGSIGARSGICYVTLTATLPGAFRIERIYAKGSSAAEQGGHVNNDRHFFSVRVNGSSIYSIAPSQGQIVVYDDSTIRTGVTTVDFEVDTSYSRPGDENNSGFAYCSLFELEIWGRI